MADSITIPARKTAILFGNAYPALPLSARHRCTMLVAICAHNCGEDSPDEPYSVTKHIRADYHESITGSTYTIIVTNPYRSPYSETLQVIRNIEQYLSNLPQLKYLSRPRKWHRLFGNRNPAHTYQLTIYDINETMEWLHDNVTPSDYQIFGRDSQNMQLALKSAEHSVMYKLHQE
jgi:hypothetical protein